MARKRRRSPSSLLPSIAPPAKCLCMAQQSTAIVRWTGNVVDPNRTEQLIIWLEEHPTERNLLFSDSSQTRKLKADTLLSVIITQFIPEPHTISIVDPLETLNSLLYKPSQPLVFHSINSTLQFHTNQMPQLPNSHPPHPAQVCLTERKVLLDTLEQQYHQTSL